MELKSNIDLWAEDGSKAVVDDRDEMNFFDGHDRFDESLFVSQPSLLEAPVTGEQDSVENGLVEGFGREWLLDQCNQHVARHMPESGFTGSQLSANVLDVLRSSETSMHFLAIKNVVDESLTCALQKTILHFLCWGIYWDLRISVSWKLSFNGAQKLFRA
jgi:hypothetical protein